MKKVILALCVFSLALFYACGGNDAAKSTTDSTASTTVASNEGQSVYNEKCTMCHGADGKAGIMNAKDLSVSTLDHATAVSQVKNGKGMMKSFSGELTDEQIDAVVKYAETLRK